MRADLNRQHLANQFTASNPCTATKYFNELASKSYGANVVQNWLRHFF